MTQASIHVSPTLLNFAGTLASRDPDAFEAEIAKLGASSTIGRNEESIALRLTDQAVRVWGAALLEQKDRKLDADTLRALAPIVDAESLRAATAALAGFDTALVSHATDCAAAASGESGTPEFIGTQAAFAAIALANGCNARSKSEVYESAVALLAELRAEPSTAKMVPLAVNESRLWR